MALIPVVSEGFIETDAPDVVFRIMRMEAEKMAIELFTEPIAHFGLHQPVFPPRIAELPRVVVSRYVQRDPRSQRRLDAKVDRGRGIVERIALDRPFLSERRVYRCQQQSQHKPNFIHFYPF